MKAVIDTRFFIVHFLAEDRETINKTRRILEDLQKENEFANGRRYYYSYRN